jgi:hypothetical protein
LTVGHVSLFHVEEFIGGTGADGGANFRQMCRTILKVAPQLLESLALPVSGRKSARQNSISASSDIQMNGKLGV